MNSFAKSAPGQADAVPKRASRARGLKDAPKNPARLLLVSALTLILCACGRATDPPQATHTAPGATTGPAIGPAATPAGSEPPASSIAATLPATIKPTLEAPDSTPLPATIKPTLEAPDSTPLPPAIHSFDFYPPQVVAGEPITLSWRATAERVLINKLDHKGRLLEPAYPVPLSGTLVITDYQQQGNRTGFLLSACSQGSCANATVSAEVLCTHEWFFSNPPPECPAAPSHTTVVAQHFERGLMLWLEAAGWRVMDEIVILYDNDPAERPRWQMMVDPWDPSMPEEDPEIVPPPGYYEPLRGFGQVWRQAFRVRERLGWATDREFVLGSGAFQCAHRAYGRCYVTGPDNALYVLEPEMSGWSIVPGPPPELPPPPPDTPEIVSFSASPSPADPTGTVTLSWHVRGAGSVTVQWFDQQMENVLHSALPPSGGLPVDPSQVKFTDGDQLQFSLSAHDANGGLMFDQNGDAISSVIRVPLLTAMTIDSFSASPDPVPREGTVTLTWNAPNAASVGITPLSPEGIFLPTEAPHLPASGSVELQVPEDYATSITYHLGARDANGVMRGTYVTVGVICPYQAYIATSCPLTQDQVWAAYEAFQGGYMVWRSDSGQIYVLYSDGSYETHEDTWSEGQAVDIAATPPPGLLAPERGFGYLWANQPGVRDRLGWATAGEVGYTTSIETVRTSLGRYPATATFLTLPDQRVLQLSGHTPTWNVLP